MSQAPAEGSGGRIVRNVIAHGAASLASVVVTLVLTPLLIDELGADGYGLWVLATTLTFTLGYLSMADLGIELSTVRFVAEARGDRDNRRMNEALSTSLALFTVIALVLTPVLALVGRALADVYEVPGQLEDEARLAFTLVALQLLLDLPRRPFAALLQGAQAYGPWQALEFAQIAITGVFLGTAAIAGWGVVGLAAGSVAAAALGLVSTAAVALLVVPEARVRIRLVSRQMIRETVSFGGQLLLFRAASLVYRQADKTIIGIALGTTMVAIYDVAFKVQASVGLIEIVAISALVPAAAYSRQEPGKLREMLIRGSAYSFAVTLPFIVAAFAFAWPLIRTYVGDEFDDAVWPARVFLLMLVLSVVVSAGQNILTGLGRLRRMLWLTLVYVVVNVGVTVALVNSLEVLGAAVGTLAAQLATFIPMSRLILDEIGVAAGSFARRVILPVLPGVLIEAALALLLYPVAADTDSLVLVALLALTAALAGLAGWFTLGLRAPERSRLVETVRSGIGLQRPISPREALVDEAPGARPELTPDHLP